MRAPVASKFFRRCRGGVCEGRKYRRKSGMKRGRAARVIMPDMLANFASRLWIQGMETETGGATTGVPIYEWSREYGREVCEREARAFVQRPETLTSV
jgi:hypothetical protein